MNIEMDNLDQLFIRACKSQNYRKRLHTTYKKFYLLGEETDEFKNKHLSIILSCICETYKLISIQDFIDKIDPDNFITRLEQQHSGKTESYYERVLTALISAIRLARVEKLVGFVPPRRYMTDGEALYELYHRIDGTKHNVNRLFLNRTFEDKEPFEDMIVNDVLVISSYTITRIK